LHYLEALACLPSSGASVPTASIADLPLQLFAQ